MSKSLMLRTCTAEMKSYNNFQWPESGPVSCDDWDPTPCCGGGLHGLLWGEGNASLLNWGEDGIEADVAYRVEDRKLVKVEAGDGE